MPLQVGLTEAVNAPTDVSHATAAWQLRIVKMPINATTVT